MLDAETISGPFGATGGSRPVAAPPRPAAAGRPDLPPPLIPMPHHCVQCTDLTAITGDAPEVSLILEVFQGGWVGGWVRLLAGSCHHGATAPPVNCPPPPGCAALNLFPTGLPPNSTLFLPNNTATKNLPSILGLPVRAPPPRSPAQPLAALVHARHAILHIMALSPCRGPLPLQLTIDFLIESASALGPDVNDRVRWCAVGAVVWGGEGWKGPAVEPLNSGAKAPALATLGSITRSAAAAGGSTHAPPALLPPAPPPYAAQLASALLYLISLVGALQPGALLDLQALPTHLQNELLLVSVCGQLTGQQQSMQPQK